MKQVNPFYRLKKWIRKRENILRRDGYECRQCKRYGKTTAATTVHHIYPLEMFPAYRLLDINLLSLCNECHNQMHNRSNNELTELGERWKNKIKKYTPPLKK